MVLDQVAQQSDVQRAYWRAVHRFQLTACEEGLLPFFAFAWQAGAASALADSSEIGDVVPMMRRLSNLLEAAQSLRSDA